jgi:AcrR family transcriptional regulator
MWELATAGAVVLRVEERRSNLAKTWSADNPKAALMDQKRAVIVAAAMDAFLDAGYAEASVNRIAAAAGVSIKTLYRHYDSKDDLFSAVMHAACGDVGRPQGTRARRPRPDWYDSPPSVALPQAGREFLKHVLLPKQVALYRVVMRDAPRFSGVRTSIPRGGRCASTSSLRRLSRSLVRAAGVDGSRQVDGGADVHRSAEGWYLRPGPI